MDFSGYNYEDNCFYFPDFDATVDANTLTILDSSNPGTDTVLGTPHMNFAGPGMGAGGATSNNTAEGYVLMVSQDGTTAFSGGVITLDFKKLVNTESIKLINATGTITLTHELGTTTVAVPDLGPNSVQTVDITETAVSVLEFDLQSKGAIINLKYSSCGKYPEKVVLPDNAPTQVPVLSTSIQGAYKIVVRSALCDGAKATFNASKAEDGIPGNIVRISNSPSSQGEKIHAVWGSGEKVKLFHRVLRAAGTGQNVPYFVCVIPN